VTGFVLDTSVTMRWCFENTTNVYAENVPRQLAAGRGATVPVLWRDEVAAVLAKAERGGAIVAAKSAEFLATLEAFDITIDLDGIDRIMTDVCPLAVACRLTGYDAVYLELAQRKNLPLVTLDADLARACRAAGGTIL
jgi:predicted nucleic acid-binding protein